MTTATPDGRRLVLEVEEGLAFTVEPLPAKRGKALSEAFVRASLNRWADEIGLPPMTELELDRILVEAIGVENYEQITGEIRAPGTFELLTEEQAGRPAPDGAPMRHEEIQQVLLAAFYWQSVVGMDGVRAFLSDPLPEVGALKALDLLLARLGHSLSTTSLLSASASRTQQQDDSSATSTPTGGKSSAVKLPARPRDRLPKRKSRRSR